MRAVYFLLWLVLAPGPSAALAVGAADGPPRATAVETQGAAPHQPFFAAHAQELQDHWGGLLGFLLAILLLIFLLIRRNRQLETQQQRLAASVATTRRQHETQLLVSRTTALLLDAGVEAQDAVLRQVVRQLGLHLNADRAYVFLLDEDGQHFSNTHEWCGARVEPQRHKVQHRPLSDTPWWWRQMEGRQLIRIPDIAELPPEAAAERAIFEDQGIRSLFAFPLRDGRKILGFVGFETVRECRDWAEEETALLEVSAEVLGAAMVRWRGERTLRASEERFRTVFDSALDGILLTDPQSRRFADANQAMCRMLGYPREALLGLGVTDIHPPERLPEILEQFERQRRGDIDLAPGVAVMRQDGSLFYADISTNRIRIGERSYILGLFRDITARKQAEAALNERLKELTCLYGVSRDLQTELSLEGIARRTVRRLVEAMQFPDITFSALQLEGLHYAAGAEAGAQAPVLWAEIFDGKRVCGRLTVGYARAEPFQLPEEQQLVRGVAEALGGWIRTRNTERHLRESEARFRRLAEHAPDIIYRYDLRPEPRFSYVSPAAAAITGYTPEEHYADPDLGRKLVHPEDRPILERAAQDKAHLNRPMVLRWIRKDGRLIWTEQRNVPVCDAAGRMIALEGIARDITERKQAEDALRKSEAKLHEAQILALMGDFTWNLETDQVTWSPGLRHLLKYNPEEPIDIHKVNAEIHHPEDLPRVTRWLREAIDSCAAAPPVAEYRLIRKDGEEIHVQTRLRVESEAGRPVRLFGACQDITELKRTEQKLQLSASVFSHAHEGILITDPAGRIVDVNQAFTAITGFTREEIVGQTPQLLKSGVQDDAFYTDLWRRLSETGHWSGEIWNRRKDGQVYAEQLTISAVRDEAGRTCHYVGLFSDITAQKRHQQELEHIARHDPLTDLPNRALLVERLRQAMAQARRQGQRLAVAFLDLDGFKAVNDTHGHAAGDQLLVVLAERFKTALREGDIVARMGGDEFVAVLLDLDDQADGLGVLERLIEAASRPVPLEQARLQVSASLGVAFFPQEPPVEAEQLLRQADQAMYQAKLQGKNRYFISQEKTPQQQRSRL